ncbi:MAG: M64 family metallopeptidase, partial [Lachnospiraceae bacterium]
TEISVGETVAEEMVTETETSEEEIADEEGAMQITFLVEDEEFEEAAESEIGELKLVYGAESEIGELKLVYGEKSLADEDAVVLLIMGDGFTAKEQKDFYKAAEETANHIMNSSPFDEFTDVFKIYALGVISNESGAQGEDASSQAEAEIDVRDTYFGATFWSYGTQRLLTLSMEGEAKGDALREEYLPLTDYNAYIVNSDTYGGSGGSYCVASLNTESLEIMVHELGHTIGGLSDEYYAPGYEEENVNLTQESDPKKVSWSRFVGKNGVGVYDWGGYGGTGWYVPSNNCKMQYLGTDHEFCEVCKEQMRKSFCADSDVTKLFFQTYADEFIAGEAKDMSEYFILRRGNNEISGDQLGDELTLTYYDAAGNELDAAPSQGGNYTVKAEFLGNDTYEACSAVGSYTIDSIYISMSIASKKQDGKPAQLKLDVQYGEGVAEDEYYSVISYYGYQYYSYSVCAEYDCYMYNTNSKVFVNYYLTDYSDYDEETGEYNCLEQGKYKAKGGPINPANYTVTVTIYDKEGNAVAEKSMDYKISFNTNKIVDNNDYDTYYGYYGANDYGNNKTVLIYGEGFTAKEQDKFNELANQLTDSILATEPFKETQLYFNFTSVNSISNESGIGVGTEANDTVFRLTCDENGVITDTSAYYATGVGNNLGYYDINSYYAACIVIVNDENVTESAAYDTYWNDPTYHYYHTIFITPDEEGMEYAAGALLNHLTWNESDYCAESEEEQEAQRLDLIYVLHYDYAPIIVSRAYDETFVEDGTAIDLTPYFEVYYAGELMSGVELALTYYDAEGNELDGAPSEAGTYTVKAETVPYDPENEYEDYWQWYVPEGANEEDGLWFGLSRGVTTYTIQPAEKPEPENPVIPSKPVKPIWQSWLEKWFGDHHKPSMPEMPGMPKDPFKSDNCYDWIKEFF